LWREQRNLDRYFCRIRVRIRETMPRDPIPGEAVCDQHDCQYRDPAPGPGPDARVRRG
jgi:hypothetical protein